ncbi:MAG: hypothetical protein JWR26_1972 [Pedosphaera sp.]|nr:hypothetical protein [Pedosphaera sp.]
MGRHGAAFGCPQGGQAANFVRAAPPKCLGVPRCTARCRFFFESFIAFGVCTRPLWAWGALHHSPPSLGSPACGTRRVAEEKAVFSKAEGWGKMADWSGGFWLAVHRRASVCIAFFGCVFLCLRPWPWGRPMWGCQTDQSDRGPRVGNSLCSPRCGREWARQTGFPSLASQVPTQDVRFAKSNLALPFGGWLARGVGW